MIDRGYVPTDRPQELKYQLLRAAADLGHQGAQLQIREEEEKLSAAQRQAVQNLRIMKESAEPSGSRRCVLQKSGLSSAEIDGHIDLTSWS
jgi:hypothetical protein